jgi:hypothetical protein
LSAESSSVAALTGIKKGVASTTSKIFYIFLKSLHPIHGGRCFDHNFLLFLANYRRKIGAFLNNQYCVQIFAKLAVTKKRWYFCQIITSVPGGIRSHDPGITNIKCILGSFTHIE